jgi:hypothetical protein
VGIYGFALGKPVDRTRDSTKHRNTGLEYREKAKCKIGREKRARLSDQKKKH